MEVRKAHAPDHYIPTVVEPGSAGVWNVHELDNGDEIFYRKSQQRQRLVPGNPYGLVLEQVRINPALEKVTFIGTAALPDRDGSTLVATKQQAALSRRPRRRRNGDATAEPVADRAPHRGARQRPNGALCPQRERVSLRIHRSVHSRRPEDRADAHLRSEHAAFAPRAFGGRVKGTSYGASGALRHIRSSESGPSSCHGMRSTQAASAAQICVTSSSESSAWTNSGQPLKSIVRTSSGRRAYRACGMLARR